MAWFKLDDQGAFHTKVVSAGNEAYGAWVRAAQWSSGRGTEGFIPRAMALTIAPLKIWQRLIAAKGPSGFGLVEPRGEDFQIHDYLDWNPTAEQVNAKRAARAEAGRQGGLRSAEARRQRTGQQPRGSPEANAEANAEAKPEQPGVPEWFTEATKTVEMASGGKVDDIPGRWLEYSAARARKGWAMNAQDAAGWLTSVLRAERSRASPRAGPKRGRAVQSMEGACFEVKEF